MSQQDQVQRAQCRHCGQDIELTGNGAWADGRGFPACVKGELKVPDYPGQPGGAISRPPVLHEPMPAGMRGEAR